jgi:flagellar basal-body rod modification protein FlgD
MTTTTTISSLGQPSAPSRTAKSSMDKDDFLKLLVEQLRHQDPMSQGKDPTEFVNQMTQFSLLEQVTNLAKANEQLTRATRMDEAVGLVGRTVSYTDEGTAYSGGVEQITVRDGKPTLTVAGRQGIDPATLTEVR